MVEYSDTIESGIDRWERETRSVFDRLGESRDILRDKAKKMQLIFQKELACRIEPLLNREADTRASQAFTYLQIRRLAEWVNDEVALLGLSLNVSTPSGNRYAVLAVEPFSRKSNSRRIEGLYFFEYKNNEGQWERTEGTISMPILHLSGTMTNAVYRDHSEQIREWTREVTEKKGPLFEIG